MGKKKPDNQNDFIPEQEGTEFKPGDEPHCKFGNQVLNANVPWDEVVAELRAKKCSIAEIAEYAECDISVIFSVLKQDYSCLNFRTGARLITLHHRFYAEQYC